MIAASLRDSALAAIIAFALFSLVLGLRTEDGALGLTLAPRPGLLATIVAIVFFGRLALNLFVWRSAYPLTTPFAKLFSHEPFERRDAIAFAAALGLGLVLAFFGFAMQEALFGLLGTVLLIFVGLGLLRRWLVQAFPHLPYAKIFVAGAIAFALLFPIVTYALQSIFNLGLPLRYWF
ncbi:MAG: DUF3382 domain-containing protein, partial [Pseudomonadota bacterium]